MISIPVSASTDYNVLIERGLIARVGEETAKLTKPAKAVIVSGPNTYPLYGETVTASLEGAGFDVLHFIHQGGEPAKSLERVRVAENGNGLIKAARLIFAGV